VKSELQRSRQNSSVNSFKYIDITEEDELKGEVGESLGNFDEMVKSEDNVEENVEMPQ
jgi:hypothetical protein